MIVEVAGNPSEYVKESLEKHVNVLNGIKDVTINSMNISEPKEIENSNGIFTCFSEIDFEVESLSRMTEIIFDFMPSSVEVIEPSKLILDTNQASALLNNISGRMHKYDEIASIAQGKIRNITKESNFLKHLLVKNKILEIKDGKLVLLENLAKEYTKEQKKDKAKKKKKIGRLKFIK